MFSFLARFLTFFVGFPLFLTVNKQMTQNFSIIELKQVSFAIECLNVTLSVAEYYQSYSPKNETVKSLSIDLFCDSQQSFNIGY